MPSLYFYPTGATNINGASIAGRYVGFLNEASGAEVGEFDRAVKYQTQAISRSGTAGPERRKMEERLELYRQHKPYRKESKFKSH